MDATKIGDEDNIRGGGDITKAERLQLLAVNSHTASPALYQMLSLTLTESKGLAMAAPPRAVGSSGGRELKRSGGGA